MIAIVGGGLAGSCLAKLFIQKKINFEWFSDEISSASHISSGIINPVTGRRFAKSWNYDSLIECAIPFYDSFVREIVIEKLYKPHKDGIDINEVVQGKEEFLSLKNNEWIEVKKSYQLDVPTFLRHVRSISEEKGFYRKQLFEYDKLRSIDSSWNYKGKIYTHIIFAEGIKVKKNPYFSTIDFRPNRGEMLEISAPEFHLSRVKKRDKFICPFEGNLWIGSSFDKVELDSPLTTDAVFEDLKEAIPTLINSTKFQILAHRGAFRSTTYNRRPIIGEHPHFKGIYLFNGFGTKGASLIPFCMNELYQLITHEKPILEEVSIKRLGNF